MVHILKSKKIEIIESLRGFASVYIVIHHFLGFTNLKRIVPGIIHFPFRFGQEMVMLFFLMSGFVIFTANQKIENIGFRKYFEKRFLRIYPIFFLALLLSFIVLLINNEKMIKSDFTDLLGNIFMLQDTDKKPGIIVNAFLRNYPLWSLSYEWWFYMLFFPLSVYFQKYKSSYKRVGIYTVLTISAISWLCYLAFPNHMLLILSNMIIWWCGVYMAQVYFSDEEISFKTLSPVYVSLFLMTLLSTLPLIKFLLNNGTGLDINGFPLIDLRHFGFALLIVLAGNFIYKSKSIDFVKLFRPMARLAPISYAMYCVHFPILLLNIPFIKNDYILFIVKFIIIILISCLFELIIQPVFYNLTKKAKLQPAVVNQFPDKMADELMAMKICIAFSGGGHYLEAMKACKIIMEDAENEIFFLTYDQMKKSDFSNRYYYVTHPKHGFILKRIFNFAVNFIDSFKVYLKEKPDVIISTGADVTLSIMLIAKIFNKKVIFIESGANVTKPSMTGKIIYRLADVFIIQWPELKEYYPKAITGISLL